jgi:hypothetical protein
MMIRIALPAALVFAVAIAACGDQSTAPRTLAPEAATYDGGLMLGSGHRNEFDSTGTSATTHSSSADSTDRGGLMLGSGH